MAHRTFASLVISALLAALLLLLARDSGLPWWLGLPILLAVIFGVYHGLMGYFGKEEARMRGRRQANAPADGIGADRIAIGALADPTLVMRDDWRVEAANDGAMQLFGPRIVGVDLRQGVRHPVVLEAAREAMGGVSPALREATTLGLHDSAWKVRAVRLGDSRLLLTFVDMTQARLTERMRADFVANASHELRTPLANISGFIETLLGPAADDEPARRRFMEIMSREAARMSRLIDDLLSLSRIELDKYVRPQGALDLSPLLLDVGRTLAMRLESDGRALKLDIPPDLPRVVGERDQILQVLHNLVSNALKYGHAGTPIQLRASVERSARGEEMVRVQVTDEGEGIPPEHLPRLTERFYRVDTGRSRSMGGTGLGLAIVKHIVERHRGRLEISSRQGVGTTIAFTLPAADE